jgi:type I restriction enzyme S subunit
LKQNSKNDNLPSTWIEVSLIDLLLSLESGARPRGGVREITEGIPSIGGEHLNSAGGFNFMNVKYIPQEYANKLFRGRIQENDILIVKDGATTGKVSIIDHTFPFDTAFVNEHVFLCRPSKYINSKYLFWFLRSEEGQQRIMKNFKGSAQGGINTSFAKYTSIPLAPISEQNRIVIKIEDVQNGINRISNRRFKIDQLEIKAFKKYIYNGNALYPQISLGKFCYERRERIGRDWKGKKLIGVSNEFGITQLRIGNKNSFEKYKVVHPNDFIYNPMRVDIGSVSIWEGDETALTSPDYIVFHIKDTLSSLLLLKFLKSEIGLSEINNNTQGSVRSRLYFKNFAKLKFPFCGADFQIEAQNIFENFKRVSKTIEQIQLKLNIVIQDTLQKAFTGKLNTFDAGDIEAKKLLNEIRIEQKLYIVESKRNKMKNSTTMNKKTQSLTSIIDILAEAKTPMSPKSVWERSIFNKDIDSFYSELRNLIEIEKKVVEIKLNGERYLKLLI